MRDTTKKIDYQCNHCGSSDLLFDAWVVWNPEEQQMEFEEICSFTFCKKCDGETHENKIAYNPEVTV